MKAPMFQNRVAAGWSRARVGLLIATLFSSAWWSLTAGTLSIAWSTVDGGGGTSTSADGRFRISGTAGQPDAGSLVGGAFELFGGFWYPQVACDCSLTIQRVGDNILVTWPATFRGCALETTGALGLAPGSTAWTPVAAVLSGGTYSYLAPLGAAPRFFRLNGL